MGSSGESKTLSGCSEMGLGSFGMAGGAGGRAEGGGPGGAADGGIGGLDAGWVGRSRTCPAVGLATVRRRRMLWKAR